MSLHTPEPSQNKGDCGSSGILALTAAGLIFVGFCWCLYALFGVLGGGAALVVLGACVLTVLYVGEQRRIDEAKRRKGGRK